MKTTTTLLLLTALLLCGMVNAQHQPPGRWCATVTAQAYCGVDVHVIQGTNDSWGAGACQSFGITTGTTCEDTNQLYTSQVTIKSAYCFTNSVYCGKVSMVCATGHSDHFDLWMPANSCLASYYMISVCDALGACSVYGCLEDGVFCICNPY